MSRTALQPDTTSGVLEHGEESARRCVACGYNLFGLGDEPRCPECGLLNIPSAYRRQVWALIDSGQWFFSGFFNAFAKRAPGWWWALDRPGDVARSFRFAGRNVLIAALLVLTLATLADSIALETTTTFKYQDADAPGEDLIEAGKWVYVIGLGGRDRLWESDVDYEEFYGSTAYGQIRSTSTKVLLKPSVGSLALGGVLTAWTFWVWAAPALIGLWTQIRKGLPEFARAPRTIIAASNYESHRLLYLGMLVAFWAMLDLVLRIVIIPTGYPGFVNAGGMAVLGISFSVFGMLGWIGPIRSDYTRQLIRSRWHGIRIVIMYALVFPWIMTVVSMGVVTFILFVCVGFDA
jgi:hypothetical protein